MSKLAFYHFLFLIFTVQPALAQQATVVKFERLERLMEEKSNQITIINFWATWCAPCVKELPLFESLTEKNDPGLKITLINLDFADKVDKVNSFIKKKNMRSEVLLLDELDYNSWIDKVDKSWAGAIPATLVINQTTGKRKFIDKELKEGDLERLILEIK